MFKSLLHNHKIFLIIVLLATILRFIHLDTIPAAISGDELLYAITAKSVFLTGHDLSGTWNPLSAFLFQYPPGEHQAELPYFIHLAFAGLFPFSLFIAKLPFALLSIGIVILLYKIAEKLFGKTAAKFTGFIAAINPWFIVMGRTGYEGTPATFFFLLSLYMVLTTQSWKILWSLVPLFLAFYSYIGTKLIFIPFTLIALVLAYTTNKYRFRKMYTTVFAVCVLFVIVYVLTQTSSGGNRISELFFPSSPTVASEVDALRKSTIQSPLLSILVNKYTVYIQILTAKLFRIFSPSYLFVEGDQFFLPVKQSFFYAIDFIFILLGSFYLFSKNKIKLFSLLLFIFIGTFPQVFHKNSGDFSGHLALMFPFIILLIGYGISSAIDALHSKHKQIALSVVLSLYIVSLIGFCVTYFYQYPLLGAGDFHMRVLSRYLSLTHATKSPITVYTTTSNDVLKKYLFYTDGMTKQSMPEITRIYSGKMQNEFQNIRFVSCDNTLKSVATGSSEIYDIKCGMNFEAPHIKISRLTDAGSIYEIFNDSLCLKYTLNPYPAGITLPDFNVEGLSTERFCKTYFN
jgi:4-amino-4-deoxy-L-arabinose transferase-like glycosyltransferase